MDEKRFQELDAKYCDLWDGECPPERQEYMRERMRRKYEEYERKQTAKETSK